MGDWTEYTRFITALLVILDPFAAIPLFLALTQSYAVAERTRVALITSITVAIVLIISALSGEALLRWMGTSLASFRVGGGVVLFLMAFAMLRGQPMDIRTTPDENIEAETKSTVAVVPLGLPLLAGPGSISTVIIEMHRFDGLYHALFVVLTILLVCTLLWLVLRMAGRIASAIGHIGLNIINRLFGLILTAIAVEIMANGLRDLFPILAQVF